MHTNRLAREKSPYLLQHAHNPVDWYPWGDEAFERAARESKPVFLSVGYATCHWCHVMERESFENDDIAGVLNEHFVSVKVDREERPDVDRMYMLFVQTSTGSGGWPMSVWLTPERKPFYGGTYFPPDNRWGRPGFRAVLESLSRAWREDRARVEESGAKVIEQLREYAKLGEAAETAGPEALDRAYHSFRRMFDSRLGGFGSAPKFPRPSVHNFLIRHYAATKNGGAKEEDALEMVLTTLQEMEKGGMNDQIGGGFHRYSVDAHWFVPHFEKMLYDQAQLAVSYLEAFQITRDGQYATAARAIFRYVLRDMTDPGGGFYSAEDADSAADPAQPQHKSEGAFYIWSKSEIDAALGAEDSALFCDHYGVRDGGNVEEDPHGEFRGRNILFQAREAPDDAAPRLKRAADKLLAIRAQRPRPLRDDKILASWNGMMISAFAKGARILGDDAYAQAARASADFLRRHLWNKQGDDQRQILLRRHREGESAIDGFLDDYAFTGLGLLDLYEAAFDPRDLAWATQLAERMITLFEDADGGGFFSSGAGSTLLRLKDDYDGAEPSGNSTAVMLLLRLARMTDRADLRTSAERALRAFSSRLREAGTGLPQMLVAHSFALAPPREIVLAGPPEHPEMGAMLAAIRRRFLPNAVVMRSEDTPSPMPALEAAPTAYVCENFACRLPVTSARALDDLLE